MTFDDDAGRHYVGMGELRIGSGAEILQATLGSCIGIAFIWKKGGRCGLAHCLLPEAPGQILRVGARFVSQAVPSLLGLMGIKPADHADVEVVVAGGAHMFRGPLSNVQVGALNADAAQRHLAAHGLTIGHVETGGRRGRQIMVDCARQSVSIQPIARQTEEVDHACI